VIRIMGFLLAWHFWGFLELPQWRNRAWHVLCSLNGRVRNPSVQLVALVLAITLPAMMKITNVERSRCS
jgi:hypothetical protein